MKRTAHGLFAALLLGGCADPADEIAMVNDKTPTANVTAAEETPEAQAVATEPVRDSEEPASPIDAESLLASTLEKAKLENKRVMVHLGAPW